MLTISGVLLVLGFMVLAPTVILINNMEEATRGSQKNGILTDTDQLLNDFNESLQAMVPPGNPDLPAYTNLSTGLQQSLKEKAALTGLYASVSLAEDPAAETYLRPSRCMAHDPGTTDEGIIVGWESDTQNAGIAGAVYDVHVTDGARTFKVIYYVRFFECLQDFMFTHAEDAWGDPGDVENLSASRKEDERPMNLTETNQDPVIQNVSPAIDPASYDIHHWSRPDNLHEEDGRTAKFVSSNVRSNYVRFGLLAPPGMRSGEELHDPEFEVIAAHNQNPLIDQTLHLQVYYPYDATEPRISEEIGPLQRDLQTFTLNLPRSPTGNMNWTYEEIVDSKWELTVQGDHNPEREIYVDHFNMTGGIRMFQPYRLDAGIEWQPIPYVYEAHDVSLRYKVEPGTPDESFELQIRDVGPGGNDTWWGLTELTDTQNDWVSFESCLPLLGTEAKWLEFRIVDDNETDNLEGDDEDTVQIDLMRIESRLEAEPCV